MEQGCRRLETPKQSLSVHFPAGCPGSGRGGSQRVDRGEEQLEHPQFTCPEVEAELSSAFPCLDGVTESQNGLGSEEP